MHMAILFRGLQRNVAMLLGRIVKLLVGQLCQGADDAEAGVAGLDDIIDVAVLGSVLRIGDQLGVLVLLLLDEGLGLVDLTLVLKSLGLLGVEDGSGACGTHDGDLG